MFMFALLTNKLSQNYSNGGADAVKDNKNFVEYHISEGRMLKTTAYGQQID